MNFSVEIEPISEERAMILLELKGKHYDFQKPKECMQFYYQCLQEDSECNLRFNINPRTMNSNITKEFQKLLLIHE